VVAGGSRMGDGNVKVVCCEEGDPWTLKETGKEA
jgi:hypothetical protein